MLLGMFTATSADCIQVDIMGSDLRSVDDSPINRKLRFTRRHPRTGDIIKTRWWFDESEPTQIPQKSSLYTSSFLFNHPDGQYDLHGYPLTLSPYAVIDRKTSLRPIYMGLRGVRPPRRAKRL